MAATVDISGSWIILSSSASADIGDALHAQGIPEHKLKGFTYDPDATLYVAVCHK